MFPRIARQQPMTEMTDLVEQLKRELAVPGQFATVYPNTNDQDLVGSLLDGVGRVQLIGFLKTSVIDFDDQSVSPDLSPAARALVVLFSADSILTMRLLEMKQRVAYEAGPVKYETEQAASTLTEILRTLRARRQEIIDGATGVGRSRGGFAMADSYAVRTSSGDYSFYVNELV